MLESVTQSDYEQKLALAFEFWEAVAANMPDWLHVE